MRPNRHSRTGRDGRHLFRTVAVDGYASTLIVANLNPKVIQARLGHATITETMDTDSNLFPNAEDVGRGAIDTTSPPLRRDLVTLL